MLCVCVRACACASAGHSVLILCVVFELCISVLVQCEGCCFPSAPPSFSLVLGCSLCTRVLAMFVQQIPTEDAQV